MMTLEEQLEQAKTELEALYANYYVLQQRSGEMAASTVSAWGNLQYGQRRVSTLRNKIANQGVTK